MVYEETAVLQHVVAPSPPKYKWFLSLAGLTSAAAKIYANNLMHPSCFDSLSQREHLAISNQQLAIASLLCFKDSKHVASHAFIVPI